MTDNSSQPLLQHHHPYGIPGASSAQQQPPSSFGHAPFDYDPQDQQQSTQQQPPRQQFSPYSLVTKFTINNMGYI